MSPPEHAIIENNLFDLPAPNGIPGSFPASFGIKFLVTNATGSAVYTSVFIRSNRVRGLNGWPAWQGSMGMQLSNIQNLTVENNIVDVKATEPDNSIRQWSCGTVQAFNNRQSTGQLLQLFNPTTSQHVPELTTEAENVLLGL